jgi:acyl carrier protein
MATQTLDRAAVREQLLRILGTLREDWEYSGKIDENTGMFLDLEFESIDAVALGTAIEEHFNQSLPFAEFLSRISERKATDITVGDLLDFLMANLKGAEKRS